MKMIFINALIITADENFSIYENGMILIDDTKIAFVGDMNIKRQIEFAADEVIDAKGNIIIPGLINAHTHLSMTLFSGYGSGLPLKEWLEDKIWPAEEKLTPQDVYIGAKMGITQMLLSGTTCFLDMYYFIDDIAKAVEEMGIRAVLSRAVLDVGGFDLKLKESIESIEKYENHNMIDIMTAAHTIYTNTTQGLLEIIDTAKKYNKSINIHISETKLETANCIKKYKKTPVEYLNDIGMFDVPVIAAHCVHLSDNDIKILHDKKVNVVHNPSSNFKLASGIAPIQKLIDAGVNVALGTDGASSNNNLDMIEEMHIAALTAKIESCNPAALDAETVIKMATINGAKALKIDKKTGSLEIGKQADLIMIDTDSPFSQPKREYLNNLVYSIGRREATMTMIAGEILQSGGIIKDFDLENLNEQFNNCIDRLC